MSESYLLFRWSRSCDLLKDRIYDFADNTEISGWLEIKTASPGFNINYRVPGTTFQYRCSTGFELPTNENPDQNLVCQGNKRVFTDDIVTCVRKYSSYDDFVKLRVLSHVLVNSWTSLRKVKRGP